MKRKTVKTEFVKLEKQSMKGIMGGKHIIIFIHGRPIVLEV
ncbi:MAG: hypothetical protein VB110_09075 [Bacteroidales bacterium]|nr:hypothetical protein [Bacteroidales bacterium]